jgi:hypothetical protein
MTASTGHAIYPVIHAWDVVRPSVLYAYWNVTTASVITRMNAVVNNDFHVT